MRMKMLNQASAVDAPIASLFHAMRLGRRATDQRRWSKSFMRWHLVSLIVALFAASDCQCQEKNLPPPPAQETNSLSSLESMLVGTWRWDVPAQEETNAFMQFRLSADRSWSSLVHSDNPLAKPDEQSGAWFVHERTLVLRIAIHSVISNCACQPTAQSFVSAELPVAQRVNCSSTTAITMASSGKYRL